MKATFSTTSTNSAPSNRRWPAEMSVAVAEKVHEETAAASAMTSFELGGVEVSAGPGALRALGELALELGGGRVLLVSDPGLLRARHVERAAELLRAAGCSVSTFTKVGENPTTAHVEAGTRQAQEHQTELIVAIGGGSAMDCAKGINFLYTNGGRMEDYWGKERAQRPMLPSIGIPTTAGTGSEAQRFALISQAESHRKMACGDKKARFQKVILDPELLATVPLQVRALTGLDAISHAVESFVTKTRNPLSCLLAREAWQRLSTHFPVHLDDPRNLDAALQMALGAHFAGAAIEQSMLGGAHACANPLTARFDLEHGYAVGLMLPSIVRFNSESVRELYVEFSGLSGEDLARCLEDFNRLAGVPTSLSSLGVEASDVAQLAADAAEQWTGQHNPRPLTVQDFEQLYRGVL